MASTPIARKAPFAARNCSRREIAKESQLLGSAEDSDIRGSQAGLAQASSRTEVSSTLVLTVSFPAGVRLQKQEVSATVDRLRLPAASPLVLAINHPKGGRAEIIENRLNFQRLAGSSVFGSRY